MFRWLTGDLRARASTDGHSIALRKNDVGVLSYDKLTALDATGRKLTARMETNESGDEIVLVVDDSSAKYPIVIDPITATQKQELAGGVVQSEARFGFSVAIDNFFAVVGAWREDVTGLPDAGTVYFFSRLSGTWLLEKTFTGDLTGWSCGWSVALSGARVVFGCPVAESS